MSLYGDAIRALRQVILLDERVRNSAVDLAWISQEVADLRDRASRLEGMLVAGMALFARGKPAARPTPAIGAVRSNRLRFRRSL